MMRWNLFGRRKKNLTQKWNLKTMFGPNLSFAAMESYKLLRTNIMFSFPDEGQCRVIGVTSAVQTEGKSSTVCNIAYAMAEAGARVLLLDADLRRPSVASKLELNHAPGLTNLLVARGSYRKVVQHCALVPDMDVITSGDTPPNPSELLGSNRMAELIKELSQDYDYIVVDLPPVTVVSDSMSISKLLDGIVMVVRAGVSDHRLLKDALRQLEMVNARILGFVYRDAEGSNRSYGYRYQNNTEEYLAQNKKTK